MSRNLVFPKVVSKQVFFARPIWLVCDGDCEHAWGRNWPEDRPKGETAPADPGTYEGVDAKPTDRTHNRWCARECERAEILARREEPAGHVCGCGRTHQHTHGPSGVIPGGGR